MLTKRHLLLISMAAVFLLCMLDFFYVVRMGPAGFFMHNLFALVCGIGFISIGYLLKDKKLDTRTPLDIIIGTGIVMCLWHIAKILVGSCF